MSPPDEKKSCSDAALLGYLSTKVTVNDTPTEISLNEKTQVNA